LTASGYFSLARKNFFQSSQCFGHVRPPKADAEVVARVVEDAAGQ